MKKTYIYAGSRSHVLEGLLKSLGPNEFSILALENSFLETYCINKNLNYHSFCRSTDLHEKLRTMKDDITSTACFISSGIPFKINIDNYRDIIFLNIHPSLLPILKGRDPAIGALLFSQPFGASIHIMNDKFDDGEIIWQSSPISLSSEFDIRDLYAFSFIHEFQAGQWLGNNLCTIHDQDFLNTCINSTKHLLSKSESYYSRSSQYSNYNPKWSNNDLVKQIRSCSLNNYGMKIDLFNSSGQDLCLTLMSCAVVNNIDEIKLLLHQLNINLCKNKMHLIYQIENKILLLRNDELLSCTAKESGFKSIYNELIFSSKA